MKGNKTRTPETHNSRNSKGSFKPDVSAIFRSGWGVLPRIQSIIPNYSKPSANSSTATSDEGYEYEDNAFQKLDDVEIEEQRQDNLENTTKTARPDSEAVVLLSGLGEQPDGYEDNEIGQDNLEKTVRPDLEAVVLEPSDEGRDRLTPENLLTEKVSSIKIDEGKKIPSSAEAAEYGNGARRQFDGFIYELSREDLSWVSGTDIAGRFCVSVSDGRYILSQARKLKEKSLMFQLTKPSNGNGPTSPSNKTKTEDVQQEGSGVSTEYSPGDDTSRVKMKSAEEYYQIALKEERHNFDLLDELRKSKDCGRDLDDCGQDLRDLENRILERAYYIYEQGGGQDSEKNYYAAEVIIYFS